MQMGGVEAIRMVAERLGPLTDRVVFLGGATLGLLITEPGAPRPRPTQDVDIIVEVVSWWDYQGSFRSQLLERGFREQICEETICRWTIEETKVDIMPTTPEILGFGNRWYPAAIAHAQAHHFPDGPNIRLVSPACFLATKLEAFNQRGRGDYLAHRDIEDVVAVVDGRSTIQTDVEEAPPEVRDFLASEVGRLLRIEAFVDSLPGKLPGDSASQARLPLLLDHLAGIGRIRLATS
jgi:hypothetical protein